MPCRRSLITILYEDTAEAFSFFYYGKEVLFPLSSSVLRPLCKYLLIHAYIRSHISPTSPKGERTLLTLFFQLDTLCSKENEALALVVV